jgi:hypothetical protein
VSRRLLSVVAALLLPGVPASADLLFSLDQTGLGTYQTGLYSPPGGISQPGLCQNSDGSGSCVIFSGLISTGNDESQDYSLNALYITMSPTNPDNGNYVFDNTYLNQYYGNDFFLNNVPGTLGPDIPGPTPFSYSGGVFEVDVEPGALQGDYFGMASLQYTDETDCLSVCTVSTDFEVVVTPEPGVFVLAATGLAALCFWRRKLTAALITAARK